MDNDFCWRCLIAGFKLGIINDCWIFHSGPVTRMDEQQNPGYRKIGDEDWENFKTKWGTDPDDHFYLAKLISEGQVRKKRPEEGPSQGIPKEIKDRRITQP